ncbi:hypothetical protein [Listeria booriae]|uniref:hypothetical protein n=1 Tax=Listeria booriae TaxID=1552123 RepID=UPI0016243CF2|nr:hypothetical protein [Listeria booriae]MBC1975462.1 hypothetical protein [Listeria booriae]MBC1984887.1 hypothetical protein [Listeria booriae]MBC2023906.1 hypothetical protein [Listeria booriae]MBC2032861.1 hypothetical protein [Listeria booriae]
MNTSNWIAFGALLVSVISVISSIAIARSSDKKHVSTSEWEKYKEKQRKRELIDRKHAEEKNRRVSLMPYFHLSVNEDIYLKGNTDDELIILPISLENLGKEAATNVSLISFKPNDDSVDNYFRTSGSKENIHYVHDYFHTHFARPGELVNFSAWCEKHDHPCNVYFKLGFTDLIGNYYEQEFRVQYWLKNSTKFSINNWSGLPEYIN